MAAFPESTEVAFEESYDVGFEPLEFGICALSPFVRLHESTPRDSLWFSHLRKRIIPFDGGWNYIS